MGTFSCFVFSLIFNFKTGGGGGDENTNAERGVVREKNKKLWDHLKTLRLQSVYFVIRVLTEIEFSGQVYDQETTYKRWQLRVFRCASGLRYMTATSVKAQKRS